ncbi:hypothetical protein ILYODFUR_015612 [Ilyodon furcidens]|uniref:Uncharacterized protein n=1 Tax=Ilyodon furcidens TaxID=33524 RepID=A0ABV0TXM5_9TELE
MDSAKILRCGGQQVFLISINLEEYKKVELSALQCLSVSLCGNFKSWFQVPATFSSGSKSSVWILPMPMYSSLRRNPFWIELRLTAPKPTSPGKRTLLTLHHLLHRILTSNVYSVLPGPASFFHSNHHSSNMLCLQSRFQFHITTCQNKLVKLFSCLLSVILHVGQISKENNDINYFI